MVGKVQRRSKHVAKSIITHPEASGGIVLPDPLHERPVRGASPLQHGGHTRSSEASMDSKSLRCWHDGHTPLAPTINGRNSKVVPGHLRLAASRNFGFPNTSRFRRQTSAELGPTSQETWTSQTMASVGERKTTTRQHFLTNRAFGNWNALPSLIVNAENVSQFKKRYDQHKGNHD
jgi:hypothetical protein